jgi:hypothetical protein
LIHGFVWRLHGAAPHASDARRAANRHRGF